MLLDAKLKPLLNQRIAIVMADGNCYRGLLTEYDSELLVLREVDETTNDEVCWKEPGEGTTRAPVCDERRGYLAWHRVVLPEVMIRVNGILRIWPWMKKKEPSPEQQAQTAVTEDENEPPIYLSHMISFG